MRGKHTQVDQQAASSVRRTRTLNGVSLHVSRPGVGTWIEPAGPIETAEALRSQLTPRTADILPRGCQVEKFDAPGPRRHPRRYSKTSPAHFGSNACQGLEYTHNNQNTNQPPLWVFLSSPTSQFPICRVVISHHYHNHHREPRAREVITAAVIGLFEHRR